MPTATNANTDIGRIERILRRDRRLVVLALATLILLAWTGLAVMARQMKSGDSVSTMLTSQMPWTSTTFSLMFLMWSVMMVGMMLPSAAPMILLFARVQRRKRADENPGLRIAAFTSGYLFVWILFSLLATGLQGGLAELQMLSPMMESTSRALGVGILFAAGIYQLTPLKHVCLKQCQSLILFLTGRWKSGTFGALTMGIEHGLFCLGCCWLLMALLFVGGIMNLIWVAAIATFVLMEKVAPYGEVVGRAGGLLLIACAGVVAFHA